MPDTLAVGDRVTVIARDTHAHYGGRNGSPRGDNRIEPGDVGVVEGVSSDGAWVSWWGQRDNAVHTDNEELRKLTDREVGSAMTTTPAHLNVDTLPRDATVLWKNEDMDAPQVMVVVSDRGEPDADGDYLLRRPNQDYDSRYAGKEDITPYEVVSEDWQVGDRVVSIARWGGANEVMVGMAGTVTRTNLEGNSRVAVKWDDISSQYSGMFGHGEYSMRPSDLGRTARADAVTPEVPDTPEVAAFKEKAWYKAQEAKKLYGFCGEIDKVLASLNIEKPKTFMPAGYYRFKGAKDLYFKPTIDAADNAWKQVRRNGELMNMSENDVRYIKREKEADRVELAHEI